MYRGKYLKGVGRTLAAANWNEGTDRYHGSGHMSVGSALRERLITQALQARGHGHTIVPCETVLLRRLSASERAAVRGGASSSLAGVTPADATLAAMTVKPADFARMGNIVFALTYADTTPQAIGTLFLEFERYLRPPDARAGCEGTPSDLVEAMDRAFHRGFEHFQTFGRLGLLWVTIVGNVALDGRVLDLETPHYFGEPFVGLRTPRGRPHAAGTYIGFEELAFAAGWRRFISWLSRHLDWLSTPLVLAQPEARAFLRELARGLRRRFSERHLLHDDVALTAGAVANLQSVWNLPTRDAARLRTLAEHARRMAMEGRPVAPPRATWTRLTPAPAPPTPTPFRFEAPAWLPCAVSPEARQFAEHLATLGAELDARRLLRALR